MLKFLGTKSLIYENFSSLHFGVAGYSPWRLSVPCLQGPTIFDRVLGLNGISTKAIILLIVMGIYFERVDMFVDISTGYALLNLVGALAVAKYLERKGVP